MYGYINKIQRAKPNSNSPSSSPDSIIQQGTPDLTGDNGTLTSSSSTSTLDSPPSTTNPAIRKLYSIAARSPSTFPQSNLNLRRLSNSEEIESSNSPSGSQFDSLHDLLERAGYRETRVITPDRTRLLHMTSRLSGTPPSLDKHQPSAISLSSSRHTNSSCSSSQAAATLRQTMQRACSDTANRSPKSQAPRLRQRQLRTTKSTGWLLGAFWRSASPPTLNVPPVPVSVPSIKIDRPSESPKHETNTDSQPETDLEQKHELQHDQEQRRAAHHQPLTRSQSRSSSASMSATFRTPPRRSTPTSATSNGSDNGSDNGSVGRARKLRPPSSPKRTLRRQSSRNQLWMGSLAYRQSKAKASTAPVRGRLTAQPGVGLGKDTIAAVDAFFEQINATRKPKRRTGLVEAFLPPSPERNKPQDTSPTKQRRLRRERAEWKESLNGLKDLHAKPRPSAPTSASASATATATATATTSTSTAVVPQLLSKPALPFLTMDPAVVLRNESCLRVAQLSMKRIKSIEALSRALRSSPPAPTHPSARVSPPPPPRLTLTSPTGAHSPQTIALDGTEFEPRSLPKHQNESQTIQRVKKPRRLKSKRSTPTINQSQPQSRPPLRIRNSNSNPHHTHNHDDPFRSDPNPAPAPTNSSTHQVNQFVVRGKSRIANILRDQNAAPLDSPTRSTPSHLLQ